MSAQIIRGTDYWDGNRGMDFVMSDGGREQAGFKGRAGDCVCRSIAIAAKLPYAEVYAALAKGAGAQRASRGRKAAASARNGINTRRKWFRDYMASLGFVWTATMRVGQGCTTRLLAGELPQGRLVVALSKHYAAVIDGVIHDTSDPQWSMIHTDETGAQRMSHRCVYGYWALAEGRSP